jgi:predicted CXXCH cytochrome family protein
MKRSTAIFLLILPALWLSESEAHVDSPLLLEGCGSCHVGHGESNEPMLAQSQEDACYLCHGSEDKRSAMKGAGRLAAQAEPVNIERELRKPYRHPVEEGTGHSPVERLPEVIRGTINHAECVDCHSPHQRIRGGRSTSYDVQGYTLSGQYVKKSSNEAEVCFKCHAQKTGRGNASRAVLSEFSPGVVSQHPISQRPTVDRTVSLNASLTPGDLMKCSDCHTNDDPNGPRGPHGSRHEYLLSGRYIRDVYVVESPFAFEFCYSCHNQEYKGNILLYLSRIAQF